MNIDLVVKIGSMALIQKERDDIDYNILSRLSKELRPGMILVSSGATEIGRLDYCNRTGRALDDETAAEAKMDYSAQGQTILMQNYRLFADPSFSIRQVLVEHTHFNDESRRETLRKFFLRCPGQNAVPIVNYNDAVSDEEIMKLEIRSLQSRRSRVYECVDNDETAAQIACLVRAERLVILTSVDGIYRDPRDPSTLIRSISAPTREELLAKIEEAKTSCVGTSRRGSNGAGAKLEYVKDAALQGTKVWIANAAYSLKQILAGSVPSTRVSLEG